MAAVARSATLLGLLSAAPPRTALFGIRHCTEPRTSRRIVALFGLGVAVGALLPACAAINRQNAIVSEIQHVQIQASGFTFDARVAGPEDGPLVLLLHGFPQSSYEWRAQIPVLAEMGFRVVAPDQRGYSPGARPAGVDSYTIPHLVGDVVEIADAFGARQFHVVGHDWGAAVAWYTGLTHPERVLSLVPISVPHPFAFGQALSNPEGEQAQRSGYMEMFRSDTAEATFLADDASALRSIYGGSGLTADEIEEYVRLLSEPGALTGALNWYRAMLLPSSGSATALTPISMPTMYVWSDADVALGREGAELTENFVQGPYRFEVLRGIGHWVPEQAPDQLNALLGEHFEAFVP